MKPHHAIIRNFASLYRKDAKTEWWTVNDENAMFAMRGMIPFTNLYCNLLAGGFVVYLDQPDSEIDRIKAELKCAYELIVIQNNTIKNYSERARTAGH